MNKRFNIPLLAAAGMFFLTMTACNKNNPYETVLPPAQVHFNGSSSQSYAIETSAAPAFTVTIGTTNVASVDRAVTFKVTSPTGATAGTQYTLDVTGGTVTIPAGQTSAQIKVQGLFPAYDGTGRKDTLLFILSEPSVTVADFGDTLTLAMRGPCFDGDVTNISIMGGAYSKTYENGSYGPYSTTISGVSSTGATTANATLTGLYEMFGPVNIKLDWTDPFNTTIEIPLQITNKEYAAGQPFYVRTKPTGPNKFSVCNQNFSFILDVLVNIGGTLYYYDNGVVYTMGR